MIIHTPIEIPEESINGLREMFIKVAVEAYSSVFSGISELPMYARKLEVKQSLGVGEDKLNTWISEGLNLTHFGGNDYRIAKHDLIDFFNARKI